MPLPDENDIPLRKRVLIGVPAFAIVGVMAAVLPWQERGDGAGMVVGEWNAERMECVTLPGPIVKAACHDDNAQIAVITAGEVDMAYCEVPRSTFMALVNSASPDEFFATRMRDDAVDGAFTCAGKSLAAIGG